MVAESDDDDEASTALPALIQQLRETNRRSQFFIAQFWQVPFAYSAISGVVLGHLLKLNANIVRPLSFVVAFIGLCVIGHMIAMDRGNRRATSNLRATEIRLGLDKVDGMTLAKILPWPYKLPMYAIACVITIAYAYIGTCSSFMADAQ